MSKRKYKSIIDLVLVLLCVFPLLVTLVMAWNDNSAMEIDFCNLVQKFAISEDLAQIIGEQINTFGIAFDGAYYTATCVLMANAILVYIFYVFVECLVWLPKFAIRLIERGSYIE